LPNAIDCKQRSTRKVNRNDNSHCLFKNKKGKMKNSDSDLYFRGIAVDRGQVYEQPQWVEVPALLLPQSGSAKRLKLPDVVCLTTGRSWPTAAFGDRFRIADLRRTSVYPLAAFG